MLEKAVTEIKERENRGEIRPMGGAERSRVALKYVDLHRKVNAAIPIEVDYYKVNKASKQAMFLQSQVDKKRMQQEQIELEKRRIIVEKLQKRRERFEEDSELSVLMNSQSHRHLSML